MDQILIFVALAFWMFPFTVFMFYTSFLQKKRNLKLLYIISFFFVLLGAVLVLLFRQVMFISMIGPLVFFSLYDIATQIFEKKYKRRPFDTAYNWESGLFADRVYNFVVTVLGLVLPLLIFVLLYDLV